MCIRDRAYGFDKLVSSIAIAKIYNDLSEGKITFEAKDIFELGLDEDNGLSLIHI